MLKELVLPVSTFLADSVPKIKYSVGEKPSSIRAKANAFCKKYLKTNY